MKHLLRSIIALALGSATATVVQAGRATVTVTNPLAAARPGAVITIPYADVLRAVPHARMFHLVVRDAATGALIPCQVTNYEHDHRGARYDDLVFQHDFAAGEASAKFIVESTEEAAPDFPSRVFARFVPERYDDFAWENDRIANRTYGPTLNSDIAIGERLRGSGVDIWGKRVPHLIIDRWYLKGHDQFHMDGEGEGLDLYSIGSSRGMGGTGVWDGRKLHTSDNFATWRVLANGPLRAVFELGYSPWDAGEGVKVAETKRVFVEAGRNFHATESTFTIEGAGEITIGIGITEHPNTPATFASDAKAGWMSLWEEGGAGGLGIAVLISPDARLAGEAHEPPGSAGGNGNHLLLVRVRSGETIRFLSGAGWQGSGQFDGREDWDRYVAGFVARVAAPLGVTIEAMP